MKPNQSFEERIAGSTDQSFIDKLIKLSENNQSQSNLNFESSHNKPKRIKRVTKLIRIDDIVDAVTESQIGNEEPLPVSAEEKENLSDWDEDA